MGLIPTFNVFAWEAFNWANIGAFLVPLLSAGSQVLSMHISMKMNNSVVTNEKGLQDEETAKKSQANQSGKMMMWTMPLMSLWIGFTVPAALSLYWFVQGVIAMVADVYLTKKYRTIYDAEDAIRLEKALEAERIEAEKERLRAERRAANPDGITENTSKKKLQQKQQREAEAAKAAAAREYAAKKGIVDEDAAKKSQANQTSKTMMYVMPIMSLVFGFTFPAAMSLYWFIQGIVALIGDVYLTKKYRKIYDAEDAVRLQKTLEQERIEAEKERIRAEKRAANPDGITENTSKKKLQQKQQREAEAAKAAAAKEYAIKKGLAEEEEVVEKTTLSGIADRPYCKGRAYDPNRYRNNTEE